MKIKQELPQFDKQPTLIIVSGRQHALIYLANKGQIDKKEEIKIDKDIYSDREGHWQRGGGGKNFGSGSVLEDNSKEERAKEFLKEISRELKKYPNDYQLYCFCPQYMEPRLKESIEKIIEIKKIFNGNYTEKHPFELLEKIQNEI